MEKRNASRSRRPSRPRKARLFISPAAALLHFNRAGCLYELARFADALAEYEAAAADPALAAVALVNAGFAALDAGMPERARTIADRARAVASGKSADLLAELDVQLGSSAAAAYRDGLSSFDQ